MSALWDQYSSEEFIIFSDSFARWFGGLHLLLLCGSVAQAAELPALEFSLKPHLCVLSEGEDSCYDELEVRWNAPTKMNLCLFQSDLEKPLKCWEEAQQGEHHFLLTADHNITFQLREKSQKTLASEAFEVIHNQKKYRRQRRNPWSFF
jgi:hypothetical protein